ncbi:uncharacterized protein SCHCODRAFT_02179018 [Schizophyllum commune H4-8]|uniref:uncharacterized protein n=1 Tax=Schizophyllum commune (strain H4-8 / FGSC 9210) TaxID=578458 RepID=UPI00215F34B1|nr:uncharacterized protein SCHCODRAFT_02179018 [Schizophyllum commune H4-8]KAI5836636.1 hypothetical protein SCHCODRAFT_02179018 [Schizophyllum commune H4-8]
MCPRSKEPVDAPRLKGRGERCTVCRRDLGALGWRDQGSPAAHLGLIVTTLPPRPTLPHLLALRSLPRPSSLAFSSSPTLSHPPRPRTLFPASEAKRVGRAGRALRPRSRVQGETNARRGEELSCGECLAISNSAHHSTCHPRSLARLSPAGSGHSLNITGSGHPLNITALQIGMELIDVEEGHVAKEGVFMMLRHDP